MREAIIKKLIDERAEHLKTVLQMQKDLQEHYDKLIKMNDALHALKDIYPEFFPKSDIIQGIGTENYKYNRKLPLRKRVKELLKSMGRFTKVSELAKIIYKEEEFFSPESEDDWQKKISAALTSLKLNPKERVIKKQIGPGTSGWAWGLEEWETEDERFYYELEIQKRQAEDEDYLRNREIFEQQQ